MPNPVGRPTKYKPEYCEAFIQAMGEGKSITQFAVSIGTTRQTLHAWKDAHPDFLDAYTRGTEIAESYWEGQLQQMMYDSKVNAPLVKLYFANRFNWSDKSAVDHTTAGEAMQPNQIILTGPDDKDS